MDNSKLSGRWRRWFSLVWANGGPLSVVVLAVALLIAVVSGPLLLRGVHLVWSGVEVTGQVTALSKHKRACADNQICVWHVVDFTFNASGIHQSGVDDVRAATFAQLREGGPVIVRYLPTDPSAPELETWPTLVNAALGLAASLLVLSGAVYLQVRSLRTVSRRRFVRDTGVRRKAVVTVHQPSRVGPLVKIEDDDDAVTDWVAGWLDETGKGGETVAQSQLELPPVGATITVYVDPTGRLPSVWQGDCGARSGVGGASGAR